MRSKHFETIRYRGYYGLFHIFSQRDWVMYQKRGISGSFFEALDLLKSLERENLPPSSHALAAVLGEVAEVPEVEVRDGPKTLMRIYLDALNMVVTFWI